MTSRHPSQPAAPGPRRGHSRSGGGNPLRRPVDRLQRLLERGLMVLLVVGSVTAAVLAGNAGYASQDEAIREQRAERHQVAARLLTDARNSAVPDPSDTAHRAEVRWTDGDGDRRADTAVVPAGSQRGEEVRIWLDREGRVSSAPPPAASRPTTAWTAGFMAAGGVVAVTLAARSAVRRLADRHRYREWEVEWREVEPRWSARWR